MPCSDSNWGRDDTAELFRRLDRATRLLCEIYTELEDENGILPNSVSNDGQAWWVQHKQGDSIRDNERR